MPNTYPQVPLPITDSWETYMNVDHYVDDELHMINTALNKFG